MLLLLASPPLSSTPEEDPDAVLDLQDGGGLVGDICYYYSALWWREVLYSLDLDSDGDFGFLCSIRWFAIVLLSFFLSGVWSSTSERVD